MFPSAPPGKSQQAARRHGRGDGPGKMKSRGWNAELGWWEDGGSVFKSTGVGEKKEKKMKGIQASQWTGGKPQRKQLQDEPTGIRSWEACSLNLQAHRCAQRMKKERSRKTGLHLYFECLSLINATSNRYVHWLIS